jgi:hypothetical protein
MKHNKMVSQVLKTLRGEERAGRRPQARDCEKKIKEIEDFSSTDLYKIKMMLENKKRTFCKILLLFQRISQARNWQDSGNASDY